MNEQELSLNFFDKVFNFIKLKTNSLHKNIYDRLEKRQLLKKFDDQLDRMIIDARLIGLTDDELTAIIVKNFDLNHSKFSISSKYFNQKFIIGISFFVLLISFLSTCTICKRYGMRFGRRILFQLENHWNWMDAYYDRCLLSATKIETSTTVQSWPMINHERCNYCEDVNQIFEIHENFTDGNNRHSLMDRITFLITNKLPFIYHDENSDEIRSWPIRKNFNRTTDFKMLYNETNFDGHGICMFRSSLINVNNPYQFFNEIDEYEKQQIDRSWFVHWENCALKEIKKIRRLYRRPSIFPPMIEFSKPNWLLLSVHDNNKTIRRTFKSILPSRQIDFLVVIQIQGQIELYLQTAINDCQNICKQNSVKSIFLSAYRSIVINPKYWQLSYRPSLSIKDEKWKNDITNSTMNLSLILTGIIV
ncbi:uncharacterized protein LOC113791830 [Dermatophagoides pteronyssinus]|uniref:uncharacterized protein LOC113791830 n=1 Tax=Dermatophagoides pteronyssinus TaxID=6956 RepID=UPI003F6641A3